jgi:hypothetical protein
MGQPSGFAAIPWRRIGNAADMSCASASYRLDIKNSVASASGSLSGYWAEATRGVSGSISGHASGATIVANVQGAGFEARVDVHTKGNSFHWRPGREKPLLQ